jgi:hypothetical protein
MPIQSTMQFNIRYFLLTVLLFVIEVLIALYSHDSVLRAYIGDVLVVILIYCFVKSFFNPPVLITAMAVLIFSYIVETLQYLKIVDKLGLRHSTPAKIIIGTSFSWLDILSYTIGILVVIIAEKMAGKQLTGTK